MHGDGHASRDWLYVDDDAEAIEALIEAPIDSDRRRGGQRRHRASTSPSRDRAARARRRRPTRGSTVEHVDERPGRSTATSARPRSWSGSPAGGRGRPSPDGLERTVAWYRENEAWWRAAAGPERPRLLVLGAGPAQLGLLAAARARRRRGDRRRPRPGRARLRAGRQRAIVSTEDEPGNRAARARARGSAGSSRRAPTGRSASPRGSQSGSACRIRSTPRPARSSRRRRASASGLPRPASHMRGAVDPRTACRRALRGQSDRSSGTARPDARPRAGRAWHPRSPLRRGVARRRLAVEELVDGPEVTVNAVSLEGEFTRSRSPTGSTADPPAFGVALAPCLAVGEHDSSAAVGAARAAAAASASRGADVHAGAARPRRPPRDRAGARLGGGTTRSSARRRSASTSTGWQSTSPRLDPTSRAVPRGQSPGGACVVFLVAPAAILRSVEGVEEARASRHPLGARLPLARARAVRAAPPRRRPRRRRARRRRRAGDDALAKARRRGVRRRYASSSMRTPA